MPSPGDSTPPERATSVPANSSRRSFTLPARVASRPRPAPASAAAPSADGIETLFVCNSTRIVSFTAANHAKRPSPSRRPRANSNDDTSEPIPWRSATERTLAAGVLRIYRVTSSNVSFLNSGDLLHTIFPRSQCWCVDGESVFVLRIRQDSYYRIELPNASAEDAEKVEQFRDVLRQVLHYEKTRSPFAQSPQAQIELPERPKSPPRRRYSNKPPEKAKKWLFDKKWKPDDTSRPVTPATEGSDVAVMSSYDDDDRSSIAAKSDVSEAVTESPATNLEFTPPKLRQRTPSILERTKVFESVRSVTAPMSMAASRASAVNANANQTPRIEETDKDLSKERKDSQDAQSIVSSADSFYSLDTHPSPSPIFEDAVAELINPWDEMSAPREPETRGRSTHRRQTSELTTRAPSEPAEEGAPVTPTGTSAPMHALNIPLSSPPSTPPLMSDSDDDSVRPPSLDVPTPPPAIRMKRLTGASQKRAFSPMPRPQNLFRPRAHAPARHFTAALIRKTYELVLGPPAHLVQLMLRIAANISQGIFNFNTYRVPRAEDKIPCAWESSDEDEWRETDDFGIPLRRLDSDSSVHRRRNYTADVD